MEENKLKITLLLHCSPLCLTVAQHSNVIFILSKSIGYSACLYGSPDLAVSGKVLWFHTVWNQYPPSLEKNLGTN